MDNAKIKHGWSMMSRLCLKSRGLNIRKRGKGPVNEKAQIPSQRGFYFLVNKSATYKY